ncbi:hypothetical protein [Amycolatopsis pretoriensis]|uniref:hypothetical protein n=1 Tax=Amycolatopsis pretoriensis TaxID=218821 RepID=UPI000A397C2C|nr:hypothetical protein [Amycolatopsis pretoriensis]
MDVLFHFGRESGRRSPEPVRSRPLDAKPVFRRAGGLRGRIDPDERREEADHFFVVGGGFSEDVLKAVDRPGPLVELVGGQLGDRRAEPAGELAPSVHHVGAKRNDDDREPRRAGGGGQQDPADAVERVEACLGIQVAQVVAADRDGDRTDQQDDEGYSE